MSTQDNIIPITYKDTEPAPTLPAPSFTPPADDTDPVEAELTRIQGPIMPEAVASAMGQLQSFASETLTFGGLSLQDAIAEVLGPDIHTTELTQCAWCTKGNGMEKDGHTPSKHTQVAGVPLCYDCRQRAAECFIRLLKKAQEE